MYEPSYYLREEARKSWNHFVSDEIVYVLDSAKIAENLIGNIAEKYIKRRLWIECHLTFEVQRSAHHVLVLIEVEKVDRGPWKLRKSKIDRTAVNRNSSMFVNITKTIQAPEEMRRWVRSIVRLKRLNNPHCTCGHSLSPIGKLFARSRNVLVQDGKLRSIRVRQSQLGELPNGLVKSTPQAVQQVTQNQRDFVRRIVDLDPNLVPSTLAIFLSENTYGFRFAEGVQTIPESVKVYLRPGCLQIGFSQGRTNVFSVHASQ